MGGCWSFLGCLRTSCISMGKITDIQNLPLLLAIFYEIIFPIDTTLYSNLLYFKSWSSWFCLEITKLWVGTWEDVAVYSCELQGASTMVLGMWMTNFSPIQHIHQSYHINKEMRIQPLLRMDPLSSTPKLKVNKCYRSSTD